jgi:hypothetical protein
LKQIVIDCAAPSALARFWAAALDDFEVRPYDDDEVARLAALGDTPQTDPGVIVDGSHVELCFRRSTSCGGRRRLYIWTWHRRRGWPRSIG